jgi:hypothetical protein
LEWRGTEPCTWWIRTCGWSGFWVRRKRVLEGHPPAVAGPTHASFAPLSPLGI